MGTATIDFPPLVSNHIPLLRTWLHEPHVAEFWQESEDEAEFRAKFLDKLHDRGVHPYLIVENGNPIGYIQSYEACKVGGGWWPEARPGVYGIDQFIGEPDRVGRGLGPIIIRKFLETLFQNLAISEIIVDPDPKNVRAIRAYEKVGFQSEGECTTPGGTAVVMRLKRQDFMSRAAQAMRFTDAIAEFSRVAGAYNGFWCVGGGWALDLFLDRQTRAHADLEIIALREEFKLLFDHFKKFSPHLIVPSEPPRFIPWAGQEFANEVVQLRLSPLTGTSGTFEFDLLLTPSANGKWICRRDESLRLPLEKVYGMSKYGIPYLSPEIVLLFKAKRAETKDQMDFDLVAPRLEPPAREWLYESLAKLYPEHKWLNLLGCGKDLSRYFWRAN